MAGLAGRQASKMLIMSVLSPEDAGREGESTAMERWEDLLQALGKQTFPAAGMPPDAARHWVFPPAVIGLAALLSLGGLIYLLLACCRCFGPRRSVAKGADV